MGTVPGKVIENEELVADANGLPLISWGAVLAGLVFIVAMSWLLYLLGLAIGVSVADMTDARAIGSGLGTGAVIWIVLSSLVVYFLGAMLTARLTGKYDKTTGMLHGVTLWGVTTALMLILSYMGITGLLQTGQAVLSSTASAVFNTASALGTGTANTVGYIAKKAPEVADSKIVNNIQARLKRRLSKIAADAAEKSGADVSPREVRETIDQLDNDVLEDIATQLIDGDTEQAKETLANNSELSKQQIDKLIEGISNEVEGTTEEIQDRVAKQFAQFVNELDTAGEAKVSSQDVRSAIQQMDAQTLQSIAIHIMQGDIEGAKDILTANTNLTDEQIDGIVTGVDREVTQTINKYQEQLDAAAEAAATYSEAVLWTVFAASAIGLALSILGGSIGAATSKRLYMAHRRQTVV